MRAERGNAHDESNFQIANKCLMLVEGPEVPKLSNIRQKLKVALLRKYQTHLDHFLKIITMVTDSAAVMASAATHPLAQNYIVQMKPGWVLWLIF